jgi:hypothetical protein
MKNLWLRITNPAKYENEQMYERWNAYVDGGMTDESATHLVSKEFGKLQLVNVMGPTFRWQREQDKIKEPE